VLEIEVKVRTDDLQGTRQKILSSGAILVKERYYEVNTLYDFRERELLAKGRALRVRTIGKRVYLTFKGPTQKSRRFKIREELETEVKNARQMKKILKALGFKSIFEYAKHRTVFRKGTLSICLDETAAGNFIELEGEREKIARFLKLLKIPRKYWIKLSYIEILRAAGKAGPGPYSSSFSVSPPSAGNPSS
jgi:predicted adenylyl cyclase CyaB